MDESTGVMHYRLREANIADVPALARLHVQTFRETHGGGPGADLQVAQWTMILAKPEPASFCFVLENEAGELIGFVRGIRHEASEPSGFDAELNKIYLLRAYQRRGPGKRLLCAAASRFAESGLNSMLLFGDQASPSNAFYEAMGGERLYASSGEFHGGYAGATCDPW